MMSKRSFCFLFFVIVIFCSSTFLESKSKEFYVLAAPEKILKGVKRIAILDFKNATGRWGTGLGRDITDAINGLLLEENRGLGVDNSSAETFQGAGKKFLKGFKGLFKKRKITTYQRGFTTKIFEIVDRSRIKAVMKEQNFSMSGLVKGRQSSRLGNYLGIQVLVTGSASSSQIRKKDYEGRTIYETLYKFNMRINSVKNGSIIGSKRVSGYNIEACARQLVNYFAPYYSFVSVKVLPIKFKKFKKRGKKASKYLFRDQFIDSLAIYSSIVREDPYNFKAIYNKGVCFELLCNYDKAMKQYSMAYQIQEDEKYIFNALERVKDQANLWRYLNRIGIKMNIEDLSVSDFEQSDANKKRIRLRGNSKIRVPIYKTSFCEQILFKIPGGTTQKVLKTEKKSYKIKLITGGFGFIRFKDADGSF